jgi:ABC-type antimicrobial peptide transport system permease subunit
VLVGAGTLLGVTLALVFTRVLRGLLSGVSATDPATFIGVALSVIVAALAAVFTPARRAVRIDPMTILRGD